MPDDHQLTPAEKAERIAKAICAKWYTPIHLGGCLPTDDGEELSELWHARELAVAKIVQQELEK
jgi:hypothetical protein